MVHSNGKIRRQLITSKEASMVDKLVLEAAVEVKKNHLFPKINKINVCFKFTYFIPQRSFGFFLFYLISYLNDYTNEFLKKKGRLRNGPY